MCPERVFERIAWKNDFGGMISEPRVRRYISVVRNFNETKCFASFAQFASVCVCVRHRFFNHFNLFLVGFFLLRRFRTQLFLRPLFRTAFAFFAIHASFICMRIFGFLSIYFSAPSPPSPNQRPAMRVWCLFLSCISSAATTTKTAHKHTYIHYLVLSSAVPRSQPNTVDGQQINGHIPRPHCQEQKEVCLLKFARVFLSVELICKKNPINRST